MLWGEGGSDSELNFKRWLAVSKAKEEGVILCREQMWMAKSIQQKYEMKTVNEMAKRENRVWDEGKAGWTLIRALSSSLLCSFVFLLLSKQIFQ